MATRTPQRYSSWMAIAFAVVILGGYVSGVVYMARLNDRIDEQAAAIALETGREESMHAIADLLEDVSTDTQRLEGYFVSPEGAVQFIELLEGLSSSVGSPVTIGDVRVENENQTTGEGTLTLSVASVGSWQSVNHLLLLLNELPVEKTIESVTLLSVGSSESAGTWSFRGMLSAPLRR